MPEQFDDERQKKSDDILEQLGLHPAQLHAQTSLGLSPSGLQKKITSDMGSEVGGGGTPTKIDTAPTTPAPAAPVTPKISAPSMTPSPLMKNSQNQTEDAQNEYNRLIKTGSGISQIQNPFVKTMARIGDIAGKAFFPSIEEMVPGTEGHHGALINQQQNRINEGLKQQKEEAGIEETESGAAVKRRTAQEGTSGKTPEELTLHDLMTGDNGNPRVNPDTQKPYNYNEAYTHLQKVKQDVKPDKEDEKLLDETDTTSEKANSGFLQRYQIIFPSKQLPENLKMGPNSKVADYKRADKQLQDVVTAQGTAEQRKAAEELRKQNLQLRQDAQDEKKSKEGRKWVVGFQGDKQVMVPESEADKYGLKDVGDAPSPDVSKSMAARHWIPMAEKHGSENKPEDMGILQLIDHLDKEGKLGSIASRWNEFLVGKVGSGDPYFEALRTKLAFSQTLLMNLHVGNRGGAYMLEHFEDLATQKKMNAETLKAGVNSELNYAKERAMMPDQGGSEKKEEKKAPGSSGKGTHWDAVKGQYVKDTDVR